MKKRWIVLIILLALMQAVILQPRRTVEASVGRPIGCSPQGPMTVLGGRITPEEATQLATDHVAAMAEQDVIPEWRGAAVGDPVAHYDLEGDITAYVFSVLKDGDDVGHVVVSSEASEHPILEFSAGPARHTIGAAQSARVAQEYGGTIRSSRPLYLGALSYYYEVFEASGQGSTPRRIVEMGTNRVVTLNHQNAPITSTTVDPGDDGAAPAMEGGVERGMLSPQADGYVNGVPNHYDRNWTSGGCDLGCDSASAGAVLKYWADSGYPNLVPVDEWTMLWSVRNYLSVNCDGFAGHPPYTSEAVLNYASDQGYSEFSTSRANCNIGNWACYNTFVNEIDSERPAILLFFPWPATGINHAVAGVGYSGDHVIVYDNAWGVGQDTYVLYNSGYTYMRVETVVAPQPDTTPPTKASSVRPNGWTGPYTQDTTPSFRWNAASDSESGIAGYYVAVDDWTPEGGSGNDWWVGNVTHFTVPSSLPDGEHIVAVTSKDNFGNVNPSNTNQEGDAPYYTFYIDTTAPSNPTTLDPGCGAQDGVWSGSCTDPTFTWSGASDHGGSGIQDYHVYWGTDPNGTPNVWRSPPSYDPGPIATDGVATYYLRIATRDNLGHQSDVETVFTLRHDGSAPTADPVAAGGATMVHSLWVDIELNAQDIGSGLDLAHLSGDGVSWDSGPYVSAATWQLDHVNRSAHTIYVEVEDQVGNRSSTATCQVCLDLYPAHPSSAGYRLWSAGPIVAGNEARSSSYRLRDTAGQVGMGGDLSSASYRLRSGFQALWPADPGPALFTPFSCNGQRVFLPIVLQELQ